MITSNACTGGRDRRLGPRRRSPDPEDDPAGPADRSSRSDDRSAGSNENGGPGTVSSVLSSSTLLRLTAVVAVGLLGAPAAAHAGGDDDDAAPVTTSPRGPWSTDAGNGARYAPSGTRRCATTGWRKTGPGLVLGLYVRGPGCRGGKRLAIAYQRCLERPRGRTGGCYARVANRCVTARVPRPLPDATTASTGAASRATRCIERRLGADPRRLRRERRPARAAPAHRPQLHALHRRRGRGRHRAGAAGGVGEPAAALDRASRATSSCAPAVRATRCASRPGRSRSTATATRCARAASRSGCCVRTAPGYVELQATSRSPAAAATARAAR